MNKWVATLVGGGQDEEAAPAKPAEPTPTFVLRRKLVYVHSFSQTGLLILGCFYTLYFLRDVFMPVALAFVLYLVLSPILRMLEKLRCPTSLGAALVTISFVGVIGGMVYLLIIPVSEWASRLPMVLDEAVDKVAVLKGPVETVAEASRQVENMTRVEGPAGPAEVVVRDGSLLGKITGNLTAIGAQALLVIVLLYFLLATGAIFREKLIKVMPTFGDKRRAFTITYEIQRQISRYLLTVALINVGLGVAVGLTLWSVRMPSPLLWGVLATFLNFIPYLGSAAGIAIVGVVALISYENLGQALVPPALYFALTTLEGQIITPSVLGRSLTLNPLVLFFAVVLWGWIWGVPGALLAVPFVVILKVICDNLEGMGPFGEFLGGRRE